MPQGQPQMHATPDAIALTHCPSVGPAIIPLCTIVLTCWPNWGPGIGIVSASAGTAVARTAATEEQIETMSFFMEAIFAVTTASVEGRGPRPRGVEGPGELPCSPAIEN